MTKYLFLMSMGVSLLWAVAFSAASKSYVYKDESGAIIYTDKLPPDAVSKQRRVIDGQGLTVDRVRAARTEEEIARSKELARLRHQQQIAIARQREEDERLLRTYSGEGDILRSEKSRLQVVKASEEQVTFAIIQHEEKLGKSVSRAAAYERRGNAVPSKVVERIRRGEQTIAGLKQQLKQLDIDRTDIRAKFAKDLNRYRELKALAGNGFGRGSNSGPKAKADSGEVLIRCDNERHCRRMWAKAKQFVIANASYGLRTYSDTVMVTSPPIQAQEIGMVVSRLGAGYPAEVFLDIRCVNNRQGREFCEGEKMLNLRAQFNTLLASVPSQ